MDRKALVSVVIICYNGEQFLAEAIDSVIAQTYNNWELFLVDDGSSDRSVKIMQEYVERYPDKIRYLQHHNHQNRGKNASRNLGITHAKGEYIALLDCDDVWLPHKLERQVAILEQHPEAGMVFSPSYHWYSWTSETEDRQKDWLAPLSIESKTLFHPPILLNLLIEWKIHPSVNSEALLRREVYDLVGLFDENFRDIHQDYAFLAQVLHSTTVFVSDEYSYKYRQHPNSTMGRLNSVIRDDRIFRYKTRLRLFKSIKNHLSQQDIKHLEVWEDLNQRISWLEPRVWLFGSTPLLSYTYNKSFDIYNRLYRWWIEFLELSILISRRILPSTFRDWLWKKFGNRLY